DQSSTPGEPAIASGVPTKPRITGDAFAAVGEGNVDRAVVVGARQAVLRVAARTRHRRLVLPLPCPVAVSARAGDHVAVRAAGRPLLLRRPRAIQRQEHARNDDHAADLALPRSPRMSPVHPSLHTAAYASLRTSAVHHVATRPRTLGKIAGGDR